jgi:hypothetical protein
VAFRPLNTPATSIGLQARRIRRSIHAPSFRFISVAKVGKHKPSHAIFARHENGWPRSGVSDLGNHKPQLRVVILSESAQRTSRIHSRAAAVDDPPWRRSAVAFVLNQGTASAVPQRRKRKTGFSPCGRVPGGVRPEFFPGAIVKDAGGNYRQGGGAIGWTGSVLPQGEDVFVPALQEAKDRATLQMSFQPLYYRRPHATWSPDQALLTASVTKTELFLPV